MRSRRILLWLAAALWAVEIFHLSSAPFSSERSLSLLARLVVRLHLPFSSGAVHTLNTLIRKCAHLTEYAVFSLLLYLALEAGERLRWRRGAALWSVLIAAFYAISDELHQAFTPGRGPSPYDCLLDTLGAALAMALLCVCLRSFQQRQGIHTCS